MTRRSVKRQEAKAAGDLGGKVTPGSGAPWHAKSDAVSDAYRVECKQTSKVGYRLTLGELAKLDHEAWSTGRLPVFQVEFLGAAGYPSRAVAVISWADFLALQEK